MEIPFDAMIAADALQRFQAAERRAPLETLRPAIAFSPQGCLIDGIGFAKVDQHAAINRPQFPKLRASFRIDADTDRHSLNRCQRDSIDQLQRKLFWGLSGIGREAWPGPLLVLHYNRRKILSPQSDDDRLFGEVDYRRCRLGEKYDPKVFPKVWVADPIVIREGRSRRFCIQRAGPPNPVRRPVGVQLDREGGSRCCRKEEHFASSPHGRIP